MKQNFLLLLEENLRYLGFGEASSFHEQLEQEIEKGNKEFQLSTETHFDELSVVEATLYFRQAENDRKYFFVRFDASLVYHDFPEYNVKQTFYINNGSGVTYKEAYNLLQGRAVYKTLTNLDEEKYTAWIQLEIHEKLPTGNYRVRQFRASYGYDLEKVLHTYPIRELEDEALRANLIYSLQKGNLHPVTFAKKEKTEKVYIAASPQFKTIVICTETVRRAQMSHFRKDSPKKTSPSPVEVPTHIENTDSH